MKQKVNRKGNGAHWKSVGVFLFLVSLIGVLSFFVLGYSPEDISEAIGEEYAYMALFVSALLGGTSLLIPFPYYVLSVSFGASGMHPLFLGLCAGLGTMIGDSIMYFAARHGRVFASGKMKIRFERALRVLMKKHPRKVPIVVFLYTAFVPLSDDLIVIPAGLLKYPFAHIIIPAFLGKVTFNMLLALAGWYGWQWLFV